MSIPISITPLTLTVSGIRHRHTSQASFRNRPRYNELPIPPLSIQGLMLIRIRPPVRSDPINQAPHTLWPPIQHMGVDHRGLDVLVAQKLPHRSYVLAVFQEMIVSVQKLVNFFGPPQKTWYQYTTSPLPGCQRGELSYNYWLCPKFV